MQTVTMIGLDIAKSVFQVHGTDAEGKVLIRRKLKRRYVLAFFEKLQPCLCSNCTSVMSWFLCAAHSTAHRSWLSALLIRPITPRGASYRARLVQGERAKWQRIR
jgi:transposase